MLLSHEFNSTKHTEITQKETNLVLYYKATIKYHKTQPSVFYRKPLLTKIPPSHFVEMFDLSTKAQTVTRVDKEKFHSDLQVYI